MAEKKRMADRKIRLIYLFSKPRDFNNPDRHSSSHFLGYFDFAGDPRFEVSAIVLPDLKKGLSYRLFRPVEKIFIALSGVSYSIVWILRILPKLRKADAVLAANDSGGLPLALVKSMGLLRNTKTGTVSTLVNRFEVWERMKTPFFRAVAAVYKWHYQQHDCVWVWSPTELSEYGSRVGSQGHLLPLEVDLAQFDHSPPTKKTDSEKYLLSFGRDPERDFQTVCDAAIRLGKRIKVVPGFETLPSIPKDPLVEIITRRLEPADLAQLYQGASAVIISTEKVTRVSGQTSLLEAMAYGKAILLSDNPALLSVYALKNDEHCLLFKQKNSDDLVRVMKRLEDEPLLRERLEKSVRTWLENQKDLRPGAMKKAIESGFKFGEVQ